MKPISNYYLIIALMFTYVLIIVSAEKWDLFLGQGILVSLLGMHDFVSICLPLFGILGISIIFYLLIKMGANIMNAKWLLTIALLFLLIPIIIIQNVESLKIEFSRGWYYFIPEMLFFILYISVLSRLLRNFKKHKGK